MFKKGFITSLAIILIAFNVSVSFAYWATQVNGDSSNATGTISVGQWVVVPEGSIAVTTEVLEGLLTGDPNYPTNADYVLIGDIDLSGSTETFVPIENFTGTFVGNGFTISGFELDVTSVPNEISEVGMFLNVGVDAEISDIKVSDVTVIQDDGSSGNNTNETTYVGVIVGNNEGTLSNIQVEGSSIETTNAVNGFLGGGSLTLYAGGLVGRNSGTIINSYARVNVILNASVSSQFFSSSTGNAYVGGLVGYNSGIISQSYATGNVTSNNDTSTSGFFSYVTVNTYTGGLVGLNASGGSVHHVFATGNITLNIDTTSGSRYIGRVVGSNQGVTSSLYRLNGSLITANQTYTEYTANTTSTSLTNLQSAVYLSTYLNFDFINVWQEVVSDYPILKN